VKYIDKARHKIYMQAYALTADPIIDALVDAQQRGVDVKVVVDLLQSRGKYERRLLPILVDGGVKVYTDSKHSIAHNKVIIVDDTITITGSYNFTHSAEQHNAENLVVIHDRNIAEQYRANWNQHFQHSLSYTNEVPR
jgi:phosphatidylserine/phosphatidylglycerophosphate/cardiolipin synthase-like enzyme